MRRFFCAYLFLAYFSSFLDVDAFRSGSCPASTNSSRSLLFQQSQKRRTIRLCANAGSTTVASQESDGERRKDIIFRLNSSTKWTVTLAHTLAVWMPPRTVVPPYIVVGGVLSVYFAQLLKKVINQERPNGAVPLDPGMPSTHALSSFFAAVAWAQFLLHSSSISPFQKLVIPGALMVSATTVAALRVFARFHSVAQVVVGAAVGAVTASCWMSMGSWLRATPHERIVFGVAWGGYALFSALFIWKNISTWLHHEKHL